MFNQAEPNLPEHLLGDIRVEEPVDVHGPLPGHPGQHPLHPAPAIGFQDSLVTKAPGQPNSREGLLGNRVLHVANVGNLAVAKPRFANINRVWVMEKCD